MCECLVYQSQYGESGYVCEACWPTYLDAIKNEVALATLIEGLEGLEPGMVPYPLRDVLQKMIREAKS